MTQVLTPHSSSGATALVQSEPYASWIARGLVKTIVSVSKIPDAYIGKTMYLLGSSDYVHGMIQLEAPVVRTADYMGLSLNDHRIDSPTRMDRGKADKRWNDGPFFSYAFNFKACTEPIKCTSAKLEDMVSSVVLSKEPCPTCGDHPCHCSKPLMEQPYGEQRVEESLNMNKEETTNGTKAPGEKSPLKEGDVS